ncbi:MAG: hypothetical protein ABIP94_05505 [Planctomycetota bacterium]
MRFLSTLLATAVLATAQSPLTTTFVNNNGGAAGGGVYFNLTSTNAAGVTICQMAVNLNSVAGTAGTINVYQTAAGGSSVPHTQAWGAPVSTASVVSAGPGQRTVVALATPIALAGGATYGMAIQAVGVANAYTNGVNAYPVPGNIFANADLSLNAGQASNVFAAGAAFSPRMVNCDISYAVGTVACPPAATVVSQGPGCGLPPASFYEQMTPAAFDLSGTCITITNTASGRIVTQGGTLNPVGSLAPATPLALTDDSQVVAGTLGLSVGSNCWVALGTGNSNAFGPTTALLLNNPATAFYSWRDLNPTIVGSGQVQYEELGTLAQVTYAGVWDFAGTTVADANTIQFQIDTATGNVVICWGTMSTLNASGTSTMVGYSPGGPSNNPGPTDISAITALVLNNVDGVPLSLTGVGRPVQGAAAVAYNVTTGNIPASALLHIGILGLNRPGFPLFAIGAPQCFLNASADVLVGPAVIAGGGPTFVWTALNLPALPPNFFGFQFNVQGAIFGTPLNNAFGLGLLTSNGLKCTVGGI